ncbi:MAG: Sjogren's syndrome/scleroderma autoantigen 1 family protein [Halobacteriaceae archaeon]
MSDFDKEAERERLREKYEAERQDRAATQRMSELLLKGATMTNKHCDECGSPIFRYDGQAFCPNCQAGALDGTADGDETTAGTATTESGAGAAAAEAGATDAEPGDGAAAAAESGAAAAAESGAAAAADPGAAAADTETTGAASDAESGTSDPEASVPGASGRGTDVGRERAAGRAGGAADRSDVPSTDGDLAGAREDLRRALATQARAAAETTDPRSARDHLEAAREAAAALAALDDVRA